MNYNGLDTIMAYLDAFPNGQIDSRQLDGEQLAQVGDKMKEAIERGSPLTPRDFGIDADSWTEGRFVEGERVVL